MAYLLIESVKDIKKAASDVSTRLEALAILFSKAIDRIVAYNWLVPSFHTAPNYGPKLCR